MSKQFNSKAASIKIQTVPGTYEATNSYASNAVVLYNGESDLEPKLFEQPRDNSTLEADDFDVVSFDGFIKGDLLIVGSATAGVIGPLDDLLKLCGHTSTIFIGPTNARIEYTPKSNNALIASAQWNQDTENTQFKDCVATWDEITLNIDEKPQLKGWRLDGVKHALGETAIPTPNESAFLDAIKILTENSKVKLNGVEVAMWGMSIKSAMKSESLPDTKVRERTVSERKPTLTLSLKAESLSVINPYTLIGTAVPVAMSAIDSADVSKGVRFDGPRFKISGVKKTKRGTNQLAYVLEGRLLKEVGDDAYKLAMGDVVEA